MQTEPLQSELKLLDPALEDHDASANHAPTIADLESSDSLPSLERLDSAQRTESISQLHFDHITEKPHQLSSSETLQPPSHDELISPTPTLSMLRPSPNLNHWRTTFVSPQTTEFQHSFGLKMSDDERSDPNSSELKRLNDRLLSMRMRLQREESLNCELIDQLENERRTNAQFVQEITEIKTQNQNLKSKLQTAEEYIQKFDSPLMRRSKSASNSPPIRNSIKGQFVSIDEAEKYYESQLRQIQEAHAQEMNHILQYKLLFASVSAKREDIESQLADEKYRSSQLVEQLELANQRATYAEEKVAMLSSQCAQLIQKLMKLGHKVQLDQFNVQNTTNTPVVSPSKRLSTMNPNT